MEPFTQLMEFRQAGMNMDSAVCGCASAQSYDSFLSRVESLSCLSSSVDERLWRNKERTTRFGLAGRLLDTLDPTDGVQPIFSGWHPFLLTTWVAISSPCLISMVS